MFYCLFARDISRARKNQLINFSYLWTISGKIGKELVTRVTNSVAKPSSYCMYPPQIRVMSARTITNVIKINANVNTCEYVFVIKY